MSLILSLSKVVVVLSVLSIMGSSCEARSIRIKARDAAGDEPAGPSEKTVALGKFQSWYVKELEKQSIGKPKVFLAENPELPGEGGVFASQEIAEDEELMRIPQNLMIYAKRILEVTEIGDVIDDATMKLLNFNDSDIIALYIANMKYCIPQNPWRLWIDVLPTKFNNVYYFTEGELKLLEGSHAYEKGIEMREQAKAAYDSLVKHKVFEKDEDKICAFDFEEWKWAVALVKSRSLKLRDEHGDIFTTVIPYFDFFNHVGSSEEKFTWGYKADSRFFHTEALTPAVKGQEVQQFYGPYPNSQLLLEYGFILPDNENNVVPVNPTFLGVDPEDDLFSLKTEVLEPYISGPKAEKLGIMGNQITQEILTAARIINSAEASAFTEDGKYFIGKPDIVTNFYVGVWFQSVCTHLLDQYPQSLKEDLNLMKTSLFSAKSARAQMAIKVRAEEKQMLSDVINAFRTENERIQELTRAAMEKDTVKTEL